VHPCHKHIPDYSGTTRTAERGCLPLFRQTTEFKNSAGSTSKNLKMIFSIIHKEFDSQFDTVKKDIVTLKNEKQIWESF